MTRDKEVMEFQGKYYRFPGCLEIQQDDIRQEADKLFASLIRLIDSQVLVERRHPQVAVVMAIAELLLGPDWDCERNT